MRHVDVLSYLVMADSGFFRWRLKTVQILAGHLHVRRRDRGRSFRLIPFAYVALLVIAISLVVLAGDTLLFFGHEDVSTILQTTSKSSRVPIILYVNQGNGQVNESKFDTMLSFASSQGFNTIFFQVYRSGNLLFSGSELSYFSSEARLKNFSIFFALYFTDPNQTIPPSIYSLGENGISLDMSTLDPGTQSVLLSTLKANFHGLTAVTTYDFSTIIKPDLLIFETYSAADSSYIHHGIIASVGVFATTSEQDYFSQLHYALTNSDGVMVFDYATLLSRGY